ncbi:MAG: efflux RND transporter permease subunit [Nannocystaceae bacterium]
MGGTENDDDHDDEGRVDGSADRAGDRGDDRPAGVGPARDAPARDAPARLDAATVGDETLGDPTHAGVDGPEEPPRAHAPVGDAQDDRSPSRPRERRRLTLADLALTRPVMVGMLLVAAFVLGLIAAFRLPLTFMPDVGASTVSVRFQVLRTTPELLEREVIRPIEEEVAGLRGLQQIQVGSGGWGVRFNLEFAPGTDIDARKAEIRERLDRARPNLPDTIQRINIDSWSQSDAPVLSLRLSSDGDLRYGVIERKIIRPIERLAGVSRVELEGVEPDELEIALDLDDARRAGVASQTITGTVRGAHQSRSLGLLYQDSVTPGVRTPGVDADPAAYAALPLRRGQAAAQAGATSTTTTTPGEGSDPTLARLGEVADISVHAKEQRNFRRLDGLPGVNIAVYADAGQSPVEVSTRVREAMEAMAQDPSLGDVRMMVFADQGQHIRNTLGDLRTTGIFGGLLGVLVLFLFLRRMRVTLIAALCIPLTLLATAGVLFLRGEELSCIVLLGLVLGVGALIDNAVVIVESIEHHLQRGEAPRRAILVGSREVALATIASTLSSVIVFLPLIFGPPADRMSAYLRPLGITFATVLLCSLVISQTAVPLLMTKALKRPEPAPRIRLLEAIARGYRWLIGRTLQWPRLAALLGLVVAASAVFPAQLLEYKLGDVDQAPEATPITLQLTGSPDHKVIAGHIEAIEAAVLAQQDAIGVEHISCNYSDWWGQCDVIPRERAQSEQDVERFKLSLSRALPERPGVRYMVGEDRQAQRRNVDRNEVQIAVRGEDMGVLMELSQRVAERLRGRLVRGTAASPEDGGYDVVTGPYDEGSREVHVRLDPTRVQRAGLRSEAIAQLVSTSFQGVPMGQVRGPGGEIELRLSAGMMGPRAQEEAPGIAELRDLRIQLPTGQEVPLSNFATFEITRSPHFVQRLDRETLVRVKIRFFNSDPEGNRALVDEALAGLDLPPGYTVGDWVPWWRDRESQNEMAINLALCLVLVYAVMASLFESFLQPFAILITGLLGCMGAPWAMWITGTTVDTTSMIGLFILIGIVVNNGIMLIDRALQLRAAGMGRDEALAQAGQDRIRPILMTAGTTVLGVVPMILHHPTLAGVYYHSVAIIVAGGLATSTVITLVFLPATYAIIEDLARSTLARWRAIVG